MVSGFEPAIPLATHGQRLHFRLATNENQSEASINSQMSAHYYFGHLRISQDICHVRMTDIEGFLTIYGHRDNLLNNKYHSIRGSPLLVPSLW